MDALLNCRLICKQRVSRLIGVSCEFVRKTSTEVHRVTMFKSQLLYQLSYAGAPVIVFAESSAACRRNHVRPPALLSKLLSNLKTVVKPRGGEFSNCWTSRTLKRHLTPGPDSIATSIWMRSVDRVARAPMSVTV